MHTAVPCTGSTADQAVSTIHVQLGATKHLTRPLTVAQHIITSISYNTNTGKILFRSMVSVPPVSLTS
jgi:hypothetical protein